MIDALKLLGSLALPRGPSVADVIAWVKAGAPAAEPVREEPSPDANILGSEILAILYKEREDHQMCWFFCLDQEHPYLTYHPLRVGIRTDDTLELEVFIIWAYVKRPFFLRDWKDVSRHGLPENIRVLCQSILLQEPGREVRVLPALAQDKETHLRAVRYALALGYLDPPG